MRMLAILLTLLDVAMIFLRLLEAEGRILKRGVMNVGWALAFVGLASLLILAATVFFLAGIFQYLAMQMSVVAASLIVSLVALALAFIFAGVSRWWIAGK